MNRLHDGEVAIRGGIMLIPRGAGTVVPANVAPDEPRIKMKWLRGKPVLAVSEILQIQSTGNHCSKVSYYYNGKFK